MIAAAINADPRPTTPPKPATRHGAETPVLDWRERLVCSRCGSRQVDMVARVKCARSPLLPPRIMSRPTVHCSSLVVAPTEGDLVVPNSSQLPSRTRAWPPDGVGAPLTRERTGNLHHDPGRNFRQPRGRACDNCRPGAPCLPARVEVWAHKHERSSGQFENAPCTGVVRQPPVPDLSPQLRPPVPFPVAVLFPGSRARGGPQPASSATQSPSRIGV
jgi:hypothetical protein